ncbi:hypothetical protein Ahia01_000547000, partial [Argonauta hians]
MNFGVNSAAEVFQEAIRQALNGLPGVVNVSDDILVFGKDQQSHETSLRGVLQRLREKNLTLNRDKCQYMKPSIEFLGHIFCADGMQPCPNKLKQIAEIPAPTNVSEVRSLLGMLNFCGARFIPNYATLTHGLRKLTQKNVEFQWKKEHDDIMKTLKLKLQEAVSLSYFDPQKTTHIYVDASPVGASAILMQQASDGSEQVVQFASRALTDTEQRYSQTEREALAVTWACEHLHVYLFGSPTVTIYTDHKPLVSLFESPKIKLPARIERWVMRTQAYNLKIVYRPGKDNPADYMSRHPRELNRPSSREQKIAEEYVQYLAINSIPKAMTLEQVQVETARDRTLQAVIQAIRTGIWQDQRSNVPPGEMRSLETLQQCAELSITTSGILLKCKHIVLPTSLQGTAVKLAHSGHQGKTKTLSLLREKVWFYGMSSAVERTVKDCFACQVATPTTTREPLQMSDLPTKPWSELSADFGHLPDGKHLFVITDEYSRYVVVDILESTSSRTVIPKLDKVFAEFGIPDSLKTDNGPPFNGHELRQYLDNMGVKHRKITPLWPRANAETERFMRTIKKSIKAAQAEHKNWRQEMFKFLLAYRTTPHSSTGKAPAEVLFGRNLKTKLPEPPLQVNAEIDATIRQNDAAAKAKMKHYADNKVYVKPSDIQVGDTVLVKDTTRPRPFTPYEPIPYVVSNKKGSMITAERNNKSITRNSSCFKKSPRPPTVEEVQDEEEVIEAEEHSEKVPTETRVETNVDEQTRIETNVDEQTRVETNVDE